MNGTGEPEPSEEDLNHTDASWGLLCSFLIFTMQTGFALLEAGCVSSRNVTNIMIKNGADVILGGLGYYMFGYALSFGKPASAFCGYGNFFLQPTDSSTKQLGTKMTQYFFQFSFATTSTTIVSGAIAERMKLHAYMVFSFLNVFTYAVGACWAWNTDVGWLNKLGFFDYAGACIVHLSGGTAALVSCALLGPRLHRFSDPDLHTMQSPTTALSGTFMLWWAWLGFNAGSTFAISGDWWRISALAAVNTLNGSIGGGLIGFIISMATKRGKISIEYFMTAVLAGLVSVTGIAAVTTTWESLIIGAIGASIAIGALHLTVKLKLDDPVGAIPCHFFAASWGVIAVGLFGKNNPANQLNGRHGLFRSGEFYLLGVQLLGVVVIIMWSSVMTACFIFLLKRTIGFRVSEKEEILGADWIEHDIQSLTLSHRLETALRAASKEKDLDVVVQRIVKDLIKQPSSTIGGNRHKIFTIDSMTPATVETAVDCRKIASHVEDVLARRLSSSKSMRSEGPPDWELLTSPSIEERVNPYATHGHGHAILDNHSIIDDCPELVTSRPRTVPQRPASSGNMMTHETLHTTLSGRALLRKESSNGWVNSPVKDNETAKFCKSDVLMDTVLH